MKKVVVLVFLFISFQVIAQNLYFGIPHTKIDSSDIIILNEIHWENGFANFSDIGMHQLEELSFFLSEIKGRAIEIRIYSFHSKDTIFNRAITEMVADRIYKFLIGQNDNLKTVLSVNPQGSSIPLFCKDDNAFLFRMNTRIEVQIGGCVR